MGDSGEETVMMSMSTLSEQGVMDVKQTACDRLLNFRVEMKVRRRPGGCALVCSSSCANPWASAQR
jgi:hypothetical protein